MIEPQTYIRGHTMKKSLLSASLVATVALAACGKKPEPAPAPAPAPAAAPAPAPAASDAGSAPAAAPAAAPAPEAKK